MVQLWKNQLATVLLFPRKNQVSEDFFFFLKYYKDMEHRANIYPDLLLAICCDREP